MARTRVEMSRALHRFPSLERKQLIDKIHNTVEQLQSWSEIVKLERRAGTSRASMQRKRARNCIARRNELREIEAASETGLVSLKRMRFR